MAMKRLSPKDYTDIKERGALILKVMGKTPEDPDALHISRKQGRHPTGKYDENITNCGRVLQYATAYTGWLPDDQEDYESQHTLKLCSRCGTVEDFQKALTEYHTWRAEWRQRQEEEEERLMEAARKERKEHIAALYNLAAILEDEAGLKATVDEENGRIVFQLHGKPFQVTKYRPD